MTAPFTIGVAVTVLGLVALLLAERAGSKAGRRNSKPIASLGFLIAAWGAGAFESDYGRVVFVALVLCLIGDVLLIWESKPCFMGGLASFLLGHLAFGGAFYMRGVDLAAAGIAFGVLLVPGIFAWSWLSPHVEKEMKAPVLCYLVVITGMVALSAGTVWLTPAWLPIAGAIGFYLSDLAVARDKFVAPGFPNRAWGLPLYYGAQLLLAASVGAS